MISRYGDGNLPDNPEVVNKILKADDNIESVSKYISKNSIVKSSNISEGISILGIDPIENNLEIKSSIILGNYFNSDSKNQIIIVRKLSDKLRVKVGDKIILFTLVNNKLPSFQNPPIISQFSVTGIYESGMPEYDDLKAYIPLQKAKTIFGMDAEISGYNIRLKNIKSIDSISENLMDVLRYPYYVRTIFQQHQNIFSWIDLQKKPIPIVLGLIVLVAIFNIVGTVLMNILERTPQVGILKSMGATKKQILTIFLIQGVYLGLIGISIGSFFAFILSKLQLEFNLITLPESVYCLYSSPIEINLINYLVVSLIAFLLTILSSLIPSFVATKIDAIKAIRFN